MTYEEFLGRKSFAKEDLLAFANGTLVVDPPDAFEARLPLPPMLMIDRVLEITRTGSRGRIVAERDVRLDDWFFQCHFRGDPIQPGCLGLDGVWQLLGFFCVQSGALGAGRALGCGEVEFFGQIRPRNGCVRTEVDVRRYSAIARASSALVVGDASVLVDDEPVYSVKQARVGTFRDLVYGDYPHASERSQGGSMRR